MSYLVSIDQVNIAQALYDLACDRADVIDGPLATLHRVKANHRALFGDLRRVEGRWA